MIKRLVLFGQGVFGLKSLLSKNTLRNVLYIVVGSFIFAFGIDAFAVPEGLAAGGVTGIATVIYALAEKQGIYLPVGTQTLVMNVFLMIPVVKAGGLRYAARTIGGILASSIFMDLLAPVVPAIGGGDLLLCAIWGGVICGLGLGIVFRSGGNTGGTDIIAQLLSRKTQWPIGTISIALDFLVVAISIPVFSLRNALYAMVMMFITGVVIDYVIDGPKNDRMAWIVTTRHEAVAREVLTTLGRGCTEVSARGSWTGHKRPMLFVILDRRELGLLKEIVRETDPDAILAVTDVQEAFGEGFKSLEEGIR